jgi:DNA-binding transcriptional regulator YiaG
MNVEYCPVANLATVLKSEIARLARKEAKLQLDPLRKANAGYRRDIAALKREVTDLSRQLKAVSKTAGKFAAAEPAEEGRKLRFSSKGLKTHREKLGLSAAEYGQLAGVSAQSIYNWEAGKATPRQAQVQSLAELRGIGKREAAKRLEQEQ